MARVLLLALLLLAWRRRSQTLTGRPSQHRSSGTIDRRQQTSRRIWTWRLVGAGIALLLSGVVGEVSWTIFNSNDPPREPPQTAVTVTPVSRDLNEQVNADCYSEMFVVVGGAYTHVEVTALFELKDHASDFQGATVALSGLLPQQEINVSVTKSPLKQIATTREPSGYLDTQYFLTSTPSGDVFSDGTISDGDVVAASDVEPVVNTHRGLLTMNATEHALYNFSGEDKAGKQFTGSIGSDGVYAAFKLIYDSNVDVANISGPYTTVVLPSLALASNRDLFEPLFDRSQLHCVRMEKKESLMLLASYGIVVGPSFGHTVEYTVPSMSDPDLFEWKQSGDSELDLSPKLIMVDRQAQQDAQKQTFLAGIGAGVAVSLATLAAQAIPWEVILSVRFRRRRS
jgi:hypothetical protein